MRAHDGTLLQFRNDEKGFCAVCVFGLRGQAQQEGRCARGVAAALKIVRALSASPFPAAKTTEPSVPEAEAAAAGAADANVACALSAAPRRATKGTNRFVEADAAAAAATAAGCGDSPSADSAAAGGSAACNGAIEDAAAAAPPAPRPRVVVGVTSGQLLCTYVGALGVRLEFTVFGDAINVSARLSQARLRTDFELILN